MSGESQESRLREEVGRKPWENNNTLQFGSRIITKQQQKAGVLSPYQVVIPLYNPRTN